MVYLTSRELSELESCKGELQRVLVNLDTLGAGIAAIHVNAAIEQLRMNLRAVRPKTKFREAAFLFPEDSG